MVTRVASVLAALLLGYVFFGGLSAPQEAAGAARAIALCVIPYTFVRSIEGMAAALKEDK